MQKSDSTINEATSTQHDAAMAVENALNAGYRVIATLDGALIDDIEQTLSQLGIWGRPLLGETLPRAQRDVGPWMIAPDRTTIDLFSPLIADDPIATTKALAKAAEREADGSHYFQAEQPGAVKQSNLRRAWSLFFERYIEMAPVIWAFPAEVEEPTIRRHLRSLNLMRVARRPRPRHPIRSGEEEVAFRHADGRIIALLLPLLRPGQVTRLLGPSSGIVAITQHKAIQVGKPIAPAELPDGPLSLEAHQVDQLEEPRYAKVDAAILALLSHDHTISDNSPTLAQVSELRRYVIAHTGFRADQHICDLVELLWHHGPHMLQRPDVAALLTQSGWSQERRCTTLKRKFPPFQQPSETV